MAQYHCQYMEDTEDADIKVAAITVAVEREAAAADIAHKTVQRSERSHQHREARPRTKARRTSPTPSSDSTTGTCVSAVVGTYPLGTQAGRARPSAASKDIAKRSIETTHERTRTPAML